MGNGKMTTPVSYMIIGIIFPCIILTSTVSAAPASAVKHLHNATSDMKIEDDKAFWDAKPFARGARNESWVSGPYTSNFTSTNTENVPSRIPGACQWSPLQFDCGNGLCIPIKKWRDCHQDCPGGVDEECWVNQVRCDGCKCVDPADEKTMCRRH